MSLVSIQPGIPISTTFPIDDGRGVIALNNSLRLESLRFEKVAGIFSRFLEGAKNQTQQTQTATNGDFGLDEAQRVWLYLFVNGTGCLRQGVEISSSACMILNVSLGISLCS